MAEKKKRIKPVVQEVSTEESKQGLPKEEAPKVMTEEPKAEVDMSSDAETSSPMSVEEPPSEEVPSSPDPIALPAAPKPKMKIGIGFFALVLVVALVVAIISGAVYVYFNGINSIKGLGSTEASPTPLSMEEKTPEPEATPKGSPVAEVKLDEYKINILNGSGKPGEAGKVRAILEKEGFKVTQTANAATYDFTDTLIQIKSSVPDSVVSVLTESLSDAYSVKEGTKLSSSSTYDIVVTVGSKTK